MEYTDVSCDANRVTGTQIKRFGSANLGLTSKPLLPCASNHDVEERIKVERLFKPPKNVSTGSHNPDSSHTPSFRHPQAYPMYTVF